MGVLRVPNAVAMGWAIGLAMIMAGVSGCADDPQVPDTSVFVDASDAVDGDVIVDALDAAPDVEDAEVAPDIADAEDAEVAPDSADAEDAEVAPDIADAEDAEVVPDSEDAEDTDGDGDLPDAEPDAVEVDADLSDAAEPDADLPDAAEPDADLPDAAEPDVADVGPDAADAEPDVAELPNLNTEPFVQVCGGTGQVIGPALLKSSASVPYLKPGSSLSVAALVLEQRTLSGGFGENNVLITRTDSGVVHTWYSIWRVDVRPGDRVSIVARRGDSPNTIAYGELLIWKDGVLLLWAYAGPSVYEQPAECGGAVCPHLWAESFVPCPTPGYNYECADPPGYVKWDTDRPALYAVLPEGEITINSTDGAAIGSGRIVGAGTRVASAPETCIEAGPTGPLIESLSAVYTPSPRHERDSACRNDSDCAPEGICSTKVVKGCVPDPCIGVECAEGLVCQRYSGECDTEVICETSSDCPAGSICLESGANCVRLAACQAGGVPCPDSIPCSIFLGCGDCFMDAECGEGMRCDDRVCVFQEPGPAFVGLDRANAEGFDIVQVCLATGESEAITTLHYHNPAFICGFGGTFGPCAGGSEEACFAPLELDSETGALTDAQWLEVIRISENALVSSIYGGVLP